MIRILTNRSHWIFMIISLLLLAGFLAYFLKAEYVKELEAIALEEKNQTFENFFTQIDTFGFASDSLKNDRVITVVKDSLGKRLQFNLKIVADDEGMKKGEFKIRTEQESKFPELIDILELPSDSSNNSVKFDSLIIVTERLGMNSPLDKNSGKVPIWSEHKHENPSLELLKINRSDDSYFGLITEDVSVSKVLRRILPQILFSLLLLISIGLTFLLIARTLRKERQLSNIRNDFMSNMSHELKTPVSTIGVALEALSSFDAGNNAELRREYINISKLEVERLGLLVDKALNISLYEQGKFVYDKQNIDIEQEITKVLRTLKVQLDNQNVELHYDANGSNFFVNVDKTHMINVIYNLIENGIKYSNDHAEIDITLTEKSSEIEIIIADKGRGIPPEFQDKVFDKFFRVPQGNTHNVKGHGLGLSYVKEVVESHGGKIILKSGIGAGTTFIITMPKSIQV